MMGSSKSSSSLEELKVEETVGEEDADEGGEWGGEGAGSTISKLRMGCCRGENKSRGGVRLLCRFRRRRSRIRLDCLINCT